MVTRNDGEPKAIWRSWHTIVTQCLIYVFICWSHRKRHTSFLFSSRFACTFLGRSRFYSFFNRLGFCRLSFLLHSLGLGNSLLLCFLYLLNLCAELAFCSLNLFYLSLKTNNFLVLDLKLLVLIFPDFVTFLRHVCKCLIIKGRYRRFGWHAKRRVK